MKTPSCSCDLLSLAPSSLTRRHFFKTSAGVFAASALPGIADIKPASETLVATLFKSLDEEQRKTLCFPFDHPLRRKVDNNWEIVEGKTVTNFLNRDQARMVREIFVGLHSPEYAETVIKQVGHDSGKQGLEDTSIALFGDPGSGKFEFVLTGRHCTRRCDGDSLAGAAFGGPIFYGHAAESFNESPDHKGNAYWFQAKRANEVFQALDGKQRSAALLGTSRGEHGNETIKLTGKPDGLSGIRAADLTADQKGLVRKVLADLLAPFRKTDADEALKLIEAAGFDNLHMAFYKNENIGNDEVWDVWQIEGPNMIWYFRGKPHVHVWAHVRADAQVV
ncbi:MAG: DUF3500 domain-containing protein [Verrucomicrobiales bacterium]